MQAIILAAGMGRRLNEYTRDNTKCMVPVCGERLIDRVLRQLTPLRLTRLIIVVGYQAANLTNHIRRSYHGPLPIEFVENPIYDKTNNIYSLWLVREQLQADDTLLLESDLIFDTSLLEQIVTNPFPNLCLVEKYENWMDGTMVCIDDDCNVVDFVSKKAFKYSDIDRYYKTINIYKFSREFSAHSYVPFLDAYCRALGNNEYYEQVLRVITLLDHTNLRALPVEGARWYEIDDAQDLEIAEVMFSEPRQKLQKLRAHDGGYWRFPKMVDFSHPTHPFFPTRRLLDELRSNFDVLVTSRPSSGPILSILASRNLGVRRDYVAVGSSVQSLLQGVSAGHTVVDETFTDLLPPEDRHPMLTNEALTANPQTVVVRDLGVEAGVPGLSLAVLACGDPAEAASVREKTERAGVNAVAESYLQIFGKYTAFYQQACRKFHEERKWLTEQLATLGLRSVASACPAMLTFEPADAAHGFDAEEVVLRLLTDGGLLTATDGAERLSVAVRRRKENQLLVKHLQSILNK